MDTRPPNTGAKTSAPYYTPQVLRTLSQKCTLLGEVSHGAITFENALGPAKNMSGGYACTSVGCTLNGTVPYVYKKFGQEKYASPEDRFLECAREVIMTTSMLPPSMFRRCGTSAFIGKARRRSLRS